MRPAPGLLPPRAIFDFLVRGLIVFQRGRGVMKIFASWSGDQSRSVAEALREWLPKVLQSSKVFMSREDIPAGERGLNKIAESLAECDFGIIVLTAANLTAPWVLFEAGAISNRFPNASRVAPILCGLRDLATVGGPLGQFQHVRFDRDGIEQLVKSVNAQAENPLDERRLQEAFAIWWPQLEAQYNQIPLDENGDTAPTDEEHRTDVEAALRFLIDESQEQRQMLGRTSEVLGTLVAALQPGGGVIPQRWTALTQNQLFPAKWHETVSGKPELNPAAPNLDPGTPSGE